MALIKKFKINNFEAVQAIIELKIYQFFITKDK